MAKYVVTIPITGRVAFEVDAEDEDQAIALAWDQIEQGPPDDDAVEWEYTEKVCSGNVFSGMQNEVAAQEIRSKAR